MKPITMYNAYIINKWIKENEVSESYTVHYICVKCKAIIHMIQEDCLRPINVDRLVTCETY